MPAAPAPGQNPAQRGSPPAPVPNPCKPYCTKHRGASHAARERRLSGKSRQARRSDTAHPHRPGPGSPPAAADRTPPNPGTRGGRPPPHPAPGRLPPWPPSQRGHRHGNRKPHWQRTPAPVPDHPTRWCRRQSSRPNPNSNPLYT